MLAGIRSSHLATVAMLVFSLVVHGSGAFAAKPKNLLLKRSQEERPVPLVRPLTPSPPTPDAAPSPLEAERLYRQGMSLVRDGNLRVAIPTLARAGQLGSGEAMVALGKVYAQGGEGVAKSDAAAERYLKQAVAMDFPHAYAALAVFYHQRDKTVGNKERAGSLLYEGITKGHTKPFKNGSGDTFSLFYFMANFAYLDTQAGTARFANASKWASQGAEAGDPASMVLLSQLYDGGNGVEKNPETALIWAQRAAELDSGTARQWQENLKKKYAAKAPEKPLTSPASLSSYTAHQLYDLGQAADKAEDFTRAAGLYQEATTRTGEDYAAHSAAQLGYYYAAGKGVSQDYHLAEKYYRQYADAGYQLGFSMLGNLYKAKHPGMIGNRMARDVLMEGIGKGYKELYVDLGDFEKDLKNYDDAKAWYWKGVAANNGEAMAALGKLYRDEDGVERNLNRAMYWARRSAATGEHYGTLLIEDLNKKGVTKEDAPSDAELAAEMGKATDGMADVLNKLPQPDPVTPPTFTEVLPTVSEALPVKPPASKPFNALSSVFDLLNRLPQAAPVSPPDISKKPDPPPASAAVESPKPAEPADIASPAKTAPSPAEAQRAEAKLLLETGLKAYQNGHFTRAFRLFRESARKGNDQAQYEAAEMLIEGQGVDKDRALGKQWLMISAMRGNADAKQLQARVDAEDAGKPKEAAVATKPPEAAIAKPEDPAVMAKPVEPPLVVDTKPVPIPITEKRVALVVGNSAYPAGAALANPRNDADDLGSALRKVGFDVVSGTDLTQRGFADVMAQFADKADRANVALIFYAGHAMQLDGENFLLPVDVRADSALNARLTSVSLQTVIGEVETRVKTTLVLLDACRNNPIEEALKAKLRQSRRALAETRGLARVAVNSPDTLVVFATQPNATAADGKGRNSPFTEALLENIAAPGVEIETLMKRVSAAVGDKTGQKQEPERLSRLKSEFYFVPVK